MSRVELKDIVKSFDGNPVIPRLNLEIESGKLTVLLGPSGCGKSTLLRLIAGLEYPDEGKILVDGEDITTLESRRRNIAMVFQNYALYPHLTVRENLAFPLQVAKADKPRIDREVTATAELLGLSSMLDRYPKTLSGGERQRTAVGRAIIRDPRLFLLDEPLSNLDFQLRNQMRGEIKSLQRRLGKTMIYVTHDQTEAMTMADTLVVLEKGKIMQQGTPDEVYHRPANVFTARFIGSPPINILHGSVHEGELRLKSVSSPICRVPMPDGGYLIGIRPDDLIASPDSTGVSMTIERVEFHGATTYLYGRLGEQKVVARGDKIVGQAHSGLDDATAAVSISKEALHFFDSKTHQRCT
ncbi:MAG: ABC transporter ATP-binding protein [candidate division Zixibacteria bacterium]|nr:ABC transporter ATP-binding protein [candidate division Zixibacteria bacterium]